jgi:quercetin dioxygenase-like cupin family protein
MTREGFTIIDVEQAEQSGNWLLVRRSIGLQAFGMNVVDIEPGERIPEHDETERDQEEVFLALRGDATIVVDGAEHDLPEGSFARLDPHLMRTVTNNGAAPVRVLIASAPRGSGFEPMGWA